ncbi:ankyrin repeat domain-containing protein [Thiotrichales bacterium 19X7-9]|nr:ankyrin repeat domain-containing protein [Thiotrichales bacterium 19X7-9]
MPSFMMSSEATMRMIQLFKNPTVSEEDALKKLQDYISNADLYIKDQFGHTLLHLAVLTNSQLLVQGLLNKMAEMDGGHYLNFTNQNGQTALFLAVNQGNYSIAKLLIQSGANKHYFSRDSISAYQLAEQKDDQDMLQILDGENIELSQQKRENLPFYTYTVPESTSYSCVIS